jgi:hypothetical protein
MLRKQLLQFLDVQLADGVLLGLAVICTGEKRHGKWFVEAPPSAFVVRRKAWEIMSDFDHAHLELRLAIPTSVGGHQLLSQGEVCAAARRAPVPGRVGRPGADLVDSPDPEHEMAVSQNS